MNRFCFFNHHQPQKLLSTQKLLTVSAEKKAQLRHITPIFALKKIKLY